MQNSQSDLFSTGNFSLLCAPRFPPPGPTPIALNLILSQTVGGNVERAWGLDSETCVCDLEYKGHNLGPASCVAGLNGIVVVTGFVSYKVVCRREFIPQIINQARVISSHAISLGVGSGMAPGGPHTYHQHSLGNQRLRGQSCSLGAEF